MPPVIEVERLHKRYGEVVAVDEVSFSVGEGEIFGIIGPNGAGKTTTIECVIGLRTPDRGHMAVIIASHASNLTEALTVAPAARPACRACCARSCCWRCCWVWDATSSPFRTPFWPAS